MPFGGLKNTPGSSSTSKRHSNLVHLPALYRFGLPSREISEAWHLSCRRRRDSVALEDETKDAFHMDFAWQDFSLHVCCRDSDHAIGFRRLSTVSGKKCNPPGELAARGSFLSI